MSSDELDRFLAIRNRTIPGFSGFGLPVRGTIVVTGGTGCIGTALLRMLGATGSHHLVSVARRPPTPEAKVPGVSYYRGDVRNIEQIRDVFSREHPDLVVHLAGQRDPGLAARRVVDTVSTNVVGTGIILRVAGELGARWVAVASTGKASRYYSSDIYAASKMLTEYRAIQASSEWGYRSWSARFTHVVDNSIIYSRLKDWTSRGADVRLHGSGLVFYGQSALESAQLLMCGTTNSEPSGVLALRNLGWPPIDLTQLAKDLISRTGSTSRIVVSGFEPGYEEETFPGTYDPVSAGEVSPLLNALEASFTTPLTLYSAIDRVPRKGSSSEVDHWLAELDEAISRSQGEDTITAILLRACRALLDFRLSLAHDSDIQRILQLTRSPLIQAAPDHRLIVQHMARIAAG